jgi:hypothetical protein
MAGLKREARLREIVPDIYELKKRPKGRFFLYNLWHAYYQHTITHKKREMEAVMRAMILALTFLSLAGTAHAQYYNSNRGSYGGLGSSYGTGSNSSSHYVSPYTRNDGGYVGGHYQTNPNNSTLDNYGTRGNLNPYTGQMGRRNPY